MEEEQKRRGSLKIFFGAAPGVGKTYAMLKAARQRMAEGQYVLAGVVETHGRSDTAALLEGLEIVPPRIVEYRGTNLLEFNTDAVLAGKPGIVLVDELAHTNAPGSRHKKRWQDVFDLLDAGINVYSTLNVQHLESLNDIVAQITGITVRETLPDSVLDRADEIELIDLPPEDLLQRLKEGKVYVAGIAEQARNNFFRKGNLLALRELALRRTAERVDEQMQVYRQTEGVKKVWPASERIMVCVGANPRSIRLIRSAKLMAAGLHGDWIAVNVEAPSTVNPSESDLRQLSDHMHLAESLGAETVTLSGYKVSEEILNYARTRNATKIIIGKPTHPRWKDKIFGSLLDEVVRGSGDIDVYVITGEGAEPLPAMPRRQASRRDWKPREWLITFVIVALCTLAAELIFPFVSNADIVMIYLLGTVINASLTGRMPSLFGALLAVAAFDFFFVPPYFTFVVDNTRNLFTFGVMFVVAFVISRLTQRVREQANVAREQERKTTALYNLSRELAHERALERISAAAIKHISDIFSCETVILLPDGTGGLFIPYSGQNTFKPDSKDLSVAQWAFEHHQPAGLGTDTLPGAKALYLPLNASARTAGVAGILPKFFTDFFDQEQIHTLEGFANQTAMAIERACLAEEAQQTLIKAETETLRNTLLSSVSHDLRTPLAVITGAATTLLQQDVTINQMGRKELLLTIYEESEHLNQIIRNVLDMTRLEAKAITVKKEWQSIEEITGVVLNRFTDKLKERPFSVNLPDDLPLIPFDPLLIEQVLSNLIDNAVKYTQDKTPLSLSAQIKGREIIIELADSGQGIPKGSEERIFEKFVRTSASGGGIGLGLTICRVIVNAHGGRIWAENRPEGGAVFRFTLPLADNPPLLEKEEE